MANTDPEALKISNSWLQKNTADQNLVNLLLSEMVIEDSQFSDNSALLVNHGITMITSTLVMSNCTVFFSEGFAETLNLQQVDTGFFNLFLTSKLYIQNNTVIKNLYALNQAVLSAISQSSVYISGDVRFIDNKSKSSKG